MGDLGVHGLLNPGAMWMRKRGRELGALNGVSLFENILRGV